jgi:hypothetical protein
VPQPLTQRQPVERASADEPRTSRHLHLISSH